MFTSLQKAAIVRLSFVIISADGKILDSESQFSCSVWHKIGVDATDGLAAKNMTALEAYNIVSQMEDSARELICAILGCLVISDGDADPNEIAQWRKISEVCNMPKMTIPEAVRIAHEKLG